MTTRSSPNKPLADVVACVVDHGRFLHVARTLGRTYGKVYYTTPEERDSPILREACIGDGFDEAERVRSVWEVKDECDVIIFTDIGFEAEQAVLSKEVPVWGAGEACHLESNKGLFLRKRKESGLPVPKHQVVKGLTNLRLALKDAEDKYIKISRFRGDWETLHWTCWEEMEGTLDSYAVRFGPLKDTITFYVFDPIDTMIEDGIDSWCVGGKFPQTVLHGMEAKDKAFIGTMQAMDKIPEETRCVNECFSSILAEMCPGAMKFSTEVRITEEGESFFIDPTCRFGSPPSQSECALIKNLPEIIYRGAVMEELVEPEYEDKFCVQAMVSLCQDRDEWRSVKIDSEIDEHLKCGFCAWVDDRLCLTPITEYSATDVGYLVHTGKTLQEAIDNLRGLCDKLPDSLKCDFGCLADILREIHEAEESGMPFTNSIVPEPEEILADG